MAWNSTLTDLNRVLARLYSTKESSYRIVSMAELPSTHISFRDAPIDNWYSILDQADKQGKVLKIIQAARTDFPNDRELAAAEQAVQNLQAASLLPSRPPIPNKLTGPQRAKLRDSIAANFNDEELRNLCSDLDIVFENLGGIGPSGKARELISYAERHSKLSDLIEMCETLRPKVDWSL